MPCPLPTLPPALGSRILLCSFPGIGGVQSFCTSLAEGLKKVGYLPHVLLENGEGSQATGVSMPPVVPSSVFRYTPFDNSYRVVSRMAKFIAAGGFDFIYPNTSAVAYRAIALLGPQRPVAIGGCTGNNEHDYACNTDFADYLDHIFSVSQAGAKVLRDCLPGRSLGISVIPHGVEPSRISLCRSFLGKLRLVFAGRFDVGKRLQDLIKVARSLRHQGVQFDMTLAGDGPERKTTEDACEQFGIRNIVSFPGFLTRDEVEHLMQESHINLLLSQSEGFGLSVLEGMKVGCVPIVTETCGCKDAIRAGANGFVVRLGDVGAVAGLVRMLEQDRALLAHMSGQAARTVQEEFSAEKEVARHREILGLAQEHHQRHAAQTIPWRYEPPTLISYPWVPNWLARELRRIKHRFAASPH